MTCHTMLLKGRTLIPAFCLFLHGCSDGGSGDDVDTDSELRYEDDGETTSDAEDTETTDDTAVDDTSTDAGDETSDVQTETADDTTDTSDADDLSTEVEGDTESDTDATDPGDTIPSDDSTDLVDEPQEQIGLFVTGPESSPSVGQTFDVSCAARTESGTEVPGIGARLTVEPDGFIEPAASGGWTAVGVGDVSFGCFDVRGFLDDAEPVTVSIIAGGAVRLVPVVRTPSVRAGTPMLVDCIGFDAFDNELGPVEAVVTAREMGGRIRATAPAGSESLTLTRAEEYDIACFSPVVPVSSEVSLLVGPADTYGLRTHMPERNPIAGTWYDVTCQGVDRYGNETTVITERINLDVDPTSMNLKPSLDRYRVRFRQIPSTPFRILCEHPELFSLSDDYVTVRPDVPNHVYIEMRPDLRGDPWWQGKVPPGGFIIAYAYVADQFGNGIDTPEVNSRLTLTLTPEGVPELGGYRLYEEGPYVWRARYVPEEGPILESSYNFSVDAGGPRIRCANPADASFSTALPGTIMNLIVEASDARGVSSMTVDGVSATLRGDGTWSARRAVQPGTNLVEVIATDGIGQVSIAACAFVAGYGYHPIDEPLQAGFALRLGPDGLDDGVRTSSPNSLADLVASVLAGSALQQQLHVALSAANPLWTGSIFLYGSATLNYRGGLRVAGPNTVSFTAQDNYLTMPLRLSNLSLPIRLVRSGGNIDGVISTASITTTATIAVDINDGLVDAYVVSLTPVTLAQLDGSFTDFFLELFFPLSEPTLRAEVEDQLDVLLFDAIDTAIGAMFDGFSGIDFAVSYEVPAIGGGEPLEGVLEALLNGGGIVDDGLAFELDTLFSFESASSREVPGVPLISPITANPDVEGAAVVIDIDVLNQGMVALWRGGLFDTTLYDFGTILDVVPGATITELRVRPDLPPLLGIRGDRVTITFGSVYTNIFDPFYGEGVLDVRFGAEVSAEIAVNLDGSLNFEDLRLERSVLSVQPLDFELRDRDALLAFTNDRILQLARDSIFSSVPQVPLPAFSGSAELAPYGLGPGTVLGIVNATTRTEVGAIVVEGSLGVQ